MLISEALNLKEKAFISLVGAGGKRKKRDKSDLFIWENSGTLVIFFCPFLI
jgi:hypothetical protein